MRGWRLLAEDDVEGIIDAEATALLLRGTVDARIHVGLDEDAQTRVDLVVATRTGVAGRGGNVRRIARFLRALDRRLAPREKR